MKTTNRQSAVLLLALMAGAVAAPAARTCEELASLKLPDTTITLAQAVAAGAFVPKPGTPNAAVAHPYPTLPAFCRVSGIIKPSEDSNIRFEVWMPSAGWNGQLEGVGNGGFAGVMPYDSLASPVARGYAAAATDTGHSGGDAKWAVGHPEQVIDYGYRAVHEMTVKAKVIVEAFYGSGPRHSYFSGCSNGGRQGLMEVQRYPADYDGVLVGAPANFYTHNFSGFVWNWQAQTAPEMSIAAKLKAIEAAALAACDARDGVADGVIDDPRNCPFDPAVLLCQGPESEGCLTGPQLAALRKIYAGPKNAKGEQVFPGYLPGGETGQGGWGLWMAGMNAQRFFANQFFSNMVFSPGWDFKTFDFDRDVKAADDKLAGILNATDPDLRAFEKRGGKLILYHGWCDAAVAPANTLDYYKSVVNRMGQRQAKRFLRLFMVPGMQHCDSGPGTSSFGQIKPAAQADPEHDILLALARWVEKGIAPERIIAAKPASASDPAKGALRTRPLCAYPKVARWTGRGSTDDAANFVCVAP